MGASAAFWIDHPSCRLHEMGAGHPERPERLDALEHRLTACGLDQRLQRRPAPPASRDALLRVHTARHVDALMAVRVPPGTLVQIDPDTAMNPHSLDAALHAAGAGIAGVDLLLENQAGFVFCAVRPPGHHAERARSMGFCLFNNIAVAAAEALARGVARVAILDFDVHYGNGTADIFAGEPRVRVCNTYQDPLYPYWEGRAGATSLIDVPLPAGCHGARYREAILQAWQPAIDAFAPQLLLISAGFDAHVRDPLAGLCLTDADYAWTGRWVRDLAQRHCQGRVLAMLEGGYDLEALAGGAQAFVEACID